MTITKNQDGSSLKLAVEGRLDTTTAPELDAELKNSLPGVKQLELDFAGLEYLSSTMKLTHVNETIMEIFEVTGFVDILTIE